MVCKNWVREFATGKTLDSVEAFVAKKWVIDNERMPPVIRCFGLVLEKERGGRKRAVFGVF